MSAMNAPAWWRAKHAALGRVEPWDEPPVNHFHYCPDCGRKSAPCPCAQPEENDVICARCWSEP